MCDSNGPCSGFCSQVWRVLTHVTGPSRGGEEERIVDEHLGSGHSPGKWSLFKIVYFWSTSPRLHCKALLFKVSRGGLSKLLISSSLQLLLALSSWYATQSTWRVDMQRELLWTFESRLSLLNHKKVALGCFETVKHQQLGDLRRCMQCMGTLPRIFRLLPRINRCTNVRSPVCYDVDRVEGLIHPDLEPELQCANRVHPYRASHHTI